MQWPLNPPPSSLQLCPHLLCALLSSWLLSLSSPSRCTGENRAPLPSDSPCCYSCCCRWGWPLSGGCWSTERRSTAHRPHSRPLGIPAQKTSSLDSTLTVCRGNNELSSGVKNKTEDGQNWEKHFPFYRRNAEELLLRINPTLHWNLVLVSIKFIML